MAIEDLELQNLQESQTDITYNTLSNGSESINLKSGEIKKIEFDISSIRQTTFELITLSSSLTKKSANFIPRKQPLLK